MCFYIGMRQSFKPYAVDMFIKTILFLIGSQTRWHNDPCRVRAGLYKDTNDYHYYEGDQNRWKCGLYWHVSME